VLRRVKRIDETQGMSRDKIEKTEKYFMLPTEAVRCDSGGSDELRRQVR
jgi:hypothetical protein